MDSLDAFPSTLELFRSYNGDRSMVTKTGILEGNRRCHVLQSASFYMRFSSLLRPVVEDREKTPPPRDP